MTDHAAPTVTHQPSDAARMRDRVPAQSLIEQVLRARAALRPRTRLEQAVGVDPVGPQALSWYAGAMGERVVAGRLAGLPEGWTVFHSVPVGRDGADIDHLVVGPGGVFTVEVKAHEGAHVGARGGTVLMGGAGRPSAQRAQAQARRVDRIVSEVLAEGPVVRPVIAVLGTTRIVVRAQSRGAHVLRAEELCRFLLTQPRRLSPAEVDALVERFDDVRSWQPVQEAGPELLVAFAGLARDVRRAARVRVTWLVGLLGLTAAGSAALLLPGVALLLGR